MNLRIGEEGTTAGCEFPYHNADGTDVVLTDDVELFTGTLDTVALIGSTAQVDDVIVTACAEVYDVVSLIACRTEIHIQGAGFVHVGFE